MKTFQMKILYLAKVIICQLFLDMNILKIFISYTEKTFKT